jgi:LacI family transcriptional regulator
VTLPAGTRRRRATIYDVARAAGVSHQTVTRVLRGFEGIRPETRERVQAALGELGYRPNMAARSLATNRSRRICALVYELLQVGPSKTI